MTDKCRARGPPMKQEKEGIPVIFTIMKDRRSFSLPKFDGIKVTFTQITCNFHQFLNAVIAINGNSAGNKISSASAIQTGRSQ